MTIPVAAAVARKTGAPPWSSMSSGSTSPGRAKFACGSWRPPPVPNTASDEPADILFLRS